ncbi:MAG: CRISPR-associated protein DxTHG motif protein [Fusobacteriales bacterium]|jgi:CRISPR-associated Csx2 family protein|nr:CRISPR-associated protein DxTHG motif protein [Fusobacteriales bacterium]
MSKILISSLGTGNNRNYRTADYLIDNKKYTEKYVANVLKKHLQIDKMFIIGTNKSIWEALYLDNVINPDESFAEKLYEFTESSNYSTELNAFDFSELEKALDEKIKVFLIKYGLDEKELLFNFDIIMQIEEFLEDGDEIYIDISHSFRSLSFYSMIILNYLQNISTKNIKINGIYYGMLDVVNELGYAPIVDLNILYEAINWIKGAHVFKNYGNSYLLSDLLENNGYNESSKKLRNFSDSLNVMYFKNLKQQIDILNKNFDVFNNINGIGKYIVPTTLKEFLDRFKKLNFDYEFLLEFAKWFYENKRYSNTILIIPELIVQYFLEVNNFENNKDNFDLMKKFLSRESNNLLNKRYLKAKDYKSDSDYENIIKIYTYFRDRRNNIAHALDDKQDYIETINGLEKKLNTLDKIIKTRKFYIEEYLEKF